MQAAQPYLSPAAAKQVLRYVCDENTVVVGGQAVMLWAYYYGVLESADSLTRDVDLFGNAADIHAADLRLSMLEHRTQVADLDDASANSGLINIRLPSHPEPVLVDYLWQVIGLGGAEIRASALPMRIAELEHPINVLHPLLCLESKITNLGRLPAKRHAAGVEQARLAIAIANHYIRIELIDRGEVRAALNAIERVAHIAQLDAASFAYHFAQLDVLQAIPHAQLDADQFQQIRWPQIKDRIAQARQALRTRLPHNITATTVAGLRF